MRWAQLLKRVWDLHVFACPCGGRSRFISAIFNPDVVEVVLAGIALRETAGTPARPPPRPHRVSLREAK